MEVIRSPEAALPIYNSPVKEWRGGDENERKKYFPI
jgi:hypothetical protein